MRHAAYLLLLLQLAACRPQYLRPTPIPLEAETEELRKMLEEEAKQEKTYLSAGFRQSGCIGNCPVYEVWIYADGKVIWCGEANVQRMGAYRAQAPQAWLDALHDAAEAAGYFELAGYYPTSGVRMKGMPESTIYFRKGRAEKSVRNHADAPLRLQQLEAFIISSLEDLEWEVAGE